MDIQSKKFMKDRMFRCRVDEYNPRDALMSEWNRLHGDVDNRTAVSKTIFAPTRKLTNISGQDLQLIANSTS